MENKKLEIIGYLENNTSKQGVWCSVDKLVQNVLFTNPNDLETALVELYNEGKITFGENFKIALTETIESAKNVNRQEGLDSMEEELQKALKSEDYERAAEYRDLITETKKSMGLD